jgi:DNA-binding NtrC family response regulator
MTRSVLVVDDDRTMVKTLCAILRRQGWKTTPAYSGEEAVRATEAEQFGAVLMDVKMPGMNGVEAFRAIKAVQPGAPVILMTAYAAHDLLADAEREGVLKVLSKPVALDALNELLERATATQHGILVVDDDPLFLRTLADALAAGGHRVHRAQRLAEALDLMTRQEPGIVLLDLFLDQTLPRDAIEAIHRLNPDVRLILYSGHTQLLDETLTTMPPGWIRASLTTPFPLDRLVELLG